MPSDVERAWELWWVGMSALRQLTILKNQNSKPGHSVGPEKNWERLWRGFLIARYWLTCIYRQREEMYSNLRT